jgi:hypothetical protein
MKNHYFFQIHITPQQLEWAEQLVAYSIENHPIPDIFARDPDGKKRQRDFRRTGTLGEIVFADAYQLPRPTRSFGAIDGQDFGQDFVLTLHDAPKSFDIKTMARKNNHFRSNYVLNLPAYQMQRPTVVTDNYFCISIHQHGNQWIASFLGDVAKSDIETGKIGKRYAAGTTRVKDDGGTFIFQRDTYEVDFQDISSPMMTTYIETLDGFDFKKLKPVFQKK